MEIKSGVGKFLDWLSAQPKFQYTAGAVVTKAAESRGKVIHEDNDLTFPLSRAGRSAERTVTALAAFKIFSIALAGVAVPLPVTIAFCISGLVLSKLAGVAAGALAQKGVAALASKVTPRAVPEEGTDAAGAPEQAAAPQPESFTFAQKLAIGLSLTALALSGISLAARFNPRAFSNNNTGGAGQVVARGVKLSGGSAGDKLGMSYGQQGGVKTVNGFNGKFPGQASV